MIITAIAGLLMVVVGITVGIAVIGSLVAAIAAASGVVAACGVKTMSLVTGRSRQVSPAALTHEFELARPTAMSETAPCPASPARLTSEPEAPVFVAVGECIDLSAVLTEPSFEDIFADVPTLAALDLMEPERVPCLTGAREVASSDARAGDWEELFADYHESAAAIY
jgi:hypothetical protein